jgi:hypothetical protein
MYSRREFWVSKELEETSVVWIDVPSALRSLVARPQAGPVAG